MFDADKLININLQVAHTKDELIPLKGFKLYLFEGLHLIQQYHGRYKFWDIIFLIFEFIQLIAFPLDKIFDESWGNHWVNTIGNFFRYFQLIFIWRETIFFVIAYIITCIYVILLIILFLHIIIKSMTKVSPSIIKFLVLMIEIQNILNIPILRTLFSVLLCKNDVIEVISEIKCQSGIHIFLIVFSIVLIVINKLIVIIFHSTLYEFGINSNKLKSGYSSANAILYDLTKLILIIIYHFVSHQMALAIITLLFSIILLINFLRTQPYSNGFTMKLYLILYTFFCWSCIICIASILLKNSNFRSGIVLLILGYPLIIIIVYVKDWDFSFDNYFSLYSSDFRNGYNSLLEIEYFLKLEDSLAEKIKTKQFKMLFSYIINYEDKCTDSDCYLKRFMKIKFTKENFEALRILLLQHAELLYKKSILKNPNNIKLRISYILFLFKKLNKKLKAKNEIILLNKFETNFECSFLIFKLQKKLNEENNEKKEDITKLEKEDHLSSFITAKEASKKIISMIENIVGNYISYWNTMLVHDWSKSEHFIKMNQIVESIKSLNAELNQKIKSLESWNLLDQDTLKIYVQYLKEIINHNEKANIFNNKISEEEENKYGYDEINLYELNYKEMSKNEDYKYIIIDLSKNKIINISLPVCKIFGYSKGELINRPLDILFPEIYNSNRKMFFENKIDDYKKKLLTSNKKINSDTWLDNNFGIDYGKFLIQVKLKWFINSIDDEKIYIIGNILHENKKIINDKEQEVVYVLTDRNLIIQYFTSNAQKILMLNHNYVMNNYNISNFITELNENLIKEFETKVEKEKEESHIGQVKNRNSRQRNTRYIKSDILKKYNYLEPNSVKVIHWKTNEISKTNNNNNNNNEISSLSINTPKKGRSSENLIFLDPTKNKANNNQEYNRNTSPSINKGINFTNICYPQINKFKSSQVSNIKENSNNNVIKQKELIFNMIVKEAKFNEHKVGYIFAFKPYINSELKKSTNINEGIKELTSSQDNLKMYASDISFMSLGEDKKKYNTPQTAFDINLQNNDKFFTSFGNEKENQFIFDADDMTYKQFKYSNKEKSIFYEEMKQLAINKINDFKKLLQKEISEEEESSESEYTSDEDESNPNKSTDSSKLAKEKLSSPKEEKNKINEENETNSLIKEKTISNNNLIKDTPGQNNLNNLTEMNKKKEEDFYHVNFNKITFYVFNYTSGYAELQKNHKMSHITYLMNQEKEKLKHSNAKFLVNARLMKGRKKGSINKKEEENEINSYNPTSMKLKEIYKELSSKKVEKSIFRMFLFSFIIFVIIILTGVLNIIIYFYLKDNIYSFFNLIQKSDNLYQNLLFVISIVKEYLMINNPLYTNTSFEYKNFYYMGLSRMIYRFYSENTFILSNLTNNFNILNKEDEEILTKKLVDIHIINPVRTTKFNFVTKKYTVYIYSAYRELNSALYHISQIPMDEIHHYNDDVFYFLKNGKSDLLLNSQNQMWILNELMLEKIKSGHKIIIICCAAIFLVYSLCVFIFSYFYKKITIKRRNYLSLLKQLDQNLILSSLHKCEKFSKKLEGKKENNDLKKPNVTLDSSSINNSEIENNNFEFINEKKNREEKLLKQRMDNNENKRRTIKNYIYQIILFLIFLLWQIGIYIYYYNRMTLYGNIASYEYYISMFASNFLFVFISIREYAFGKNVAFYNQTSNEFLNNTFGNFYVTYADAAKKKDFYRVYFPDSYQVFLNYLYNKKICEFIDLYKHEYPYDDTNCDTFLYGSSRFGFFTVLTAFVEELRTLKDKIDYYYAIAEQKKFIYNESLYNEPNGFYEEFVKQYENNSEEYLKYNPIHIFNTNSHRILFVTYLYINTQVYNSLISESLSQFEQIFKKYNSINLILNIVFLIVVALGFILVWIPFLFYIDKNLFKIKNMIYIIPSDLLMNIPNINNLLEIE